VDPRKGKDMTTRKKTTTVKGKPRKAGVKKEAMKDLEVKTRKIAGGTWSGPGDEGPEESITFKR
jgi:hypothetical protein